jgi:hypothetical protein
MKVVVITLVLLLSPCSSQSSSNAFTDEKLVFEGKILKIASPVPASGQFAFYRLAKYRIERVCRGRYDGSEIVVDHLSLTTKELDGIRIGDRVCVTVRPSKRIFTRTNVEGIREESEKIKVFYIGGEVPPPNSPCDCQVK